ncbi:MAG: 4-vinyl reductase [Candidatus Diapherotrites archaeon]
MEILEGVAEELFKRQIRYKGGRHFIAVPNGEPERMNWFSSCYWAFLQKRLVDEFGGGYYPQEYMAAKLTGHIFGSKISSLIKGKHIVAPLISLIVKQFGYGNIKVAKTNYEDDWLTFEFYDPPVGRELSKFFGFQKFPVDYAIAGLVAGCAEQLVGRKFITMETSCVACGDAKCTMETLSLSHFEEKLGKIKNKGQKELLSKILEIEKKTDFPAEVKKMMQNRDKRALFNERNYLASEKIV